MTTNNPAPAGGPPSTYRRQLEQALADHLAIVAGHAAGEPEKLPWEFDAALVALRWIADELRTVTLSESEDGHLPF